jgi:hypothetical protein
MIYFYGAKVRAINGHLLDTGDPKNVDKSQEGLKSGAIKWWPVDTNLSRHALEKAEIQGLKYTVHDNA